MSREYRVSIGILPDFRPQVEVVKPELKCRPDAEEIPHTYPDGSVCLYFPRYFEWTPADAVATTLIPWLSEWLYYYEVWFLTNEWLGGGIHNN
jgi:hypothetical protein